MCVEGYLSSFLMLDGSIPLPWQSTPFVFVCLILTCFYLVYICFSLVNIFFLSLLNSPTHIFSDALQSNPGWVIIVILVMVPCTSHSVSKIISVMNCTQYGFMFPLSQEYSKLI